MRTIIVFPVVITLLAFALAWFAGTIDAADPAEQHTENVISRIIYFAVATSVTAIVWVVYIALIGMSV